MASSGPRSATASASIVTGWTDLTNVYSSGDAYAQSNTVGSIMSAHGLGFSIPTGSTILGIQVYVEG